MQASDLIDFEQEIAQLFADKQIKAPVHLSSGNEQQLIDVFNKHVKPDSWVLCSWRSHLHCLLKGVPREEVKKAILDGRSIALCFPKYRVLSSAIVGGTCPISVGLGMGIKRKGEDRNVICFVGDMTAETGAFHECVKYSCNYNLPILWVIEDNGFSVRTPTTKAWGSVSEFTSPNVVRYNYVNRYPHCGLDQWVAF